MKKTISKSGAYTPIPDGTKKQSKVEKWKWQLVDEPGVLLNLHKTDLFVDDEYQRDLQDSKVVSIAREWSWVACGVLTVADRNGTFFVIDGMHRAAAAMRRSDISELPCIIFSLDETKKEALGFLRANTNRKALTSYDKFRALLAVEDETAIFVDRLIKQANRTPHEKTASGAKKGVRCLSKMMSLAKNSEETLSRIWPLVTELCENEFLHQRILGGMFYLETRMPNGDSLTRSRWRNRVLKVGYEEMLASINKATAFYENGGDKVYALGILQAINKNLVHRLNIPELGT